jgi:hypothetical protein
MSRIGWQAGGTTSRWDDKRKGFVRMFEGKTSPLLFCSSTRVEVIVVAVP